MQATGAALTRLLFSARVIVHCSLGLYLSHMAEPNPDDLLSEAEVRAHLAEERAKVVAASQAGFQLIAKVQELEKELAEKQEIFEASDRNREEMVRTQLKCEKMEARACPPNMPHHCY